MQPNFQISDTRTESLGGGREGSSADINLNVISIAVKVKTMVADDLTEWGDVHDKEERPKDRTLGYTSIYRSNTRFVAKMPVMPTDGSLDITDRKSVV